LEKLRPDNTCIHSSAGLIPYVLSDENEAYAIYLRAIGTKNTVLQIKTGGGKYNVQSLNTITGSYNNLITITSLEGIISIDIDIPDGELALKIDKV